MLLYSFLVLSSSPLFNKILLCPSQPCLSRVDQQHFICPKMNLHLRVLLVFSCLLLCVAYLSLAIEDPELKQCKHQCKTQQQFTEQDKKDCIEKCERYYKEKKEREHGKEKYYNLMDSNDEKKLTECQNRCERSGGQVRALCRFRCQRRYGSGGEEYYEEQEDENPYVFREEDFEPRFEVDIGTLRVLKRFTKKSMLHSGVDMYRIAIVETAPHAFLHPTHLDAETVSFVTNGRGTITIIGGREGKTQTFNVQYGDVMRIPEGTPMNVINRDENDKLRIVSLVKPANIPGEYESFYGPVPIYRAFSSDILEAALKSDRGRLEKIWSGSSRGIVKASKEQVEAMSHREEGGGIWPFGGETSGPFNLLHKRPTPSNNYGQLFEARPSQYQQLRQLNLIVSFANITQGCMAGPFFNSKATKISMVLDGEGYFEMVVPNQETSLEKEKGGSGGFRRVRSGLKPGMVFVVPSGHPVAVVASENRHLSVVCFEVNGEGNDRYTLAGKRNFVSEMEKEEKELAFGVKSREVDEIFGTQNEELFYPGPGRQHLQDRAQT